MAPPMAGSVNVSSSQNEEQSLKRYYKTKIEDAQQRVTEKTQNLRRLQAQRNELNSKVRMLKEELQQLHEQGSYVGEVSKAMDKKKVLVKVRMLKEELQQLHEQGSYVGEVSKAMDKKKVLVKVHPEGKYVVDVDKGIDVTAVNAGCRVALRADSYALHKILPNKNKAIF
ncbi:26S protease regulatory subunit 8 [Toxocara canis]|uniref:26S protease regulatory subunit 8 n=1 Tax=Toxocara canis TaxID=6265 RepID=A0A0B2V2S5_TOXCA|nr:26S protease regulatory subunit 8 [Toxocara canis]